MPEHQASQNVRGILVPPLPGPERKVWFVLRVRTLRGVRNQGITGDSAGLHRRWHQAISDLDIFGRHANSKARTSWSSSARKNWMPTAVSPAARWVFVMIAILSLAGVVVSSVSLYHHYWHIADHLLRLWRQLQLRHCESQRLLDGVRHTRCADWIPRIRLSAESGYSLSARRPELRSCSWLPRRRGLRFCALPDLHREIRAGNMVHFVSFVAHADYFHNGAGCVSRGQEYASRLNYCPINSHRQTHWPKPRRALTFTVGSHRGRESILDDGRNHSAASRADEPVRQW